MTRRTRLLVAALGATGLAALLVAACFDLPGFGGRQHPYGDRVVRASLARHTANTIASVNFDQRAFDTLGEMSILFASVLGTVVLLRQTRDEHRDPPAPEQVALPVRRYALLVLPVAVVTGLYVIAHGQLSPGGGFQGGVVVATALHLLYLGADYRALERIRPRRLLRDRRRPRRLRLPGPGPRRTRRRHRVPRQLPSLRHLQHPFLGRHRPLLNAAIGMEVACAVVVLLARFLDQAVEIEKEGEK